jgi:hypothetical protein
MLFYNSKNKYMTTAKNTMDCFADANGQYCLNIYSGQFSVTEGQCCNFSDFTAPAICASQPTAEYSAYCGRGQLIVNKFLREFLIPADATYCPVDQDKVKHTVLSTHTGATDADYLMKEHPFKVAVPTTAAASWHCKYIITSEDSLATAALATRGYTYIETEQYGFDDNVIVIVQPRAKYYPFNFRSQTNNPDKMTKVFKAQFGRKFLIPAEYDILIDFAPIAYNSANLAAGYQQ